VNRKAGEAADQPTICPQDATVTMLLRQPADPAPCMMHRIVLECLKHHVVGHCSPNDCQPAHINHTAACWFAILFTAGLPQHTLRPRAVCKLACSLHRRSKLPMTDQHCSVRDRSSCFALRDSNTCHTTNHASLSQSSPAYATVAAVIAQRQTCVPRAWASTTQRLL
jgi:hypothetical protein